jgi:DNA-binding CsgD family transcriptional regulator
MIRNELLIQRYAQGITLVGPHLLGNLPTPRTTVADIMSFPFNFYFMDCNSMMQRINEATAKTNGYLSTQDAIGKSIRDISKPETIETILANDRKVREARAYQVLTESFTRHDTLELTALSIKFPWYHHNTIIGIVGCSMLLGDAEAASFTQALTLLIETGLLTAPESEVKSLAKLAGPPVAGVYFDQRDKAIMYWLVRGKTAKNIGNMLALSHRTIEHRLEVIKQKLAVSSKAALIEKIIDRFMIIPEEKVVNTL